MRPVFPLLCLALGLIALRADADEQSCLTSIGGEQRALVYDPDEPNVRANRTLRERTLGGPKGIDCPGYVTLSSILRDLDPEITYAQMQPFCLQYDAELATYVGVNVGRRDARLLCRASGRSLCQRVNETKESAVAVAGLGTKVLSGVNSAATAAGVSAVADGSGAMILSGPAGYLSSAFASLGAGALSVLTAPATLTTAAVTVVVVGGAVYACAE